MKKFFVLCLTGFMLFILTSCGKNAEPKLVNTVEIKQVVNQIKVDYDADDLKVKYHNKPSIILKEYMNEDNQKYYAEIDSSQKSVKITEGKRPKRTSFKAFVELILPEEFDQNLTLHTTSGAIDLLETKKEFDSISLDTTSGEIQLRNSQAKSIKLTTTSGKLTAEKLAATDEMIVESTSGSVEFKDIAAENYQIKTTSGETSLENVTGNVHYTTTSGKLNSSDLVGGGKFEATGGGDIQLVYKKVEQDISMDAKNGQVTLDLPTKTNYQIKINTKNGTIESNSEFNLKGNQQEKIGGTKDSEYVVKLATKNGNIDLKGH
ncbi:DUF4097 family beta strand repeat-containing protein [Enterococcus sp. AZ103]|uniref:DUF4097 family beta strand repeat-containing protein n=1 Tax=Enterococcus sp. AZ103 TaxID=2774628 RepID=UPI003F1EA777